MKPIKISDLQISIRFPRKELADYIKLAQKIGIFICTGGLSVSIWFGLPLTALLFIDIEIGGDLDEPEN